MSEAAQAGVLGQNNWTPWEFDSPVLWRGVPINVPFNLLREGTNVFQNMQAEDVEKLEHVIHKTEHDTLLILIIN